MMKLDRHIARMIGAALLAATSPAPAADPDYNREIRPILSQNCYACHGPDEAKRKADLRLDDAAVAAKVLSGGDKSKSEVFRRITAGDDDHMPPADSGKSLTPAQIEALGKWIDAGASYAAHWSFVRPVRPATPAVSPGPWARNAVDAFVLSRLDAEGIRPAPEADKSTLLRRVYLDLIGLPPSVAQAQAFLADESAGAYEKVVDELLASPHFGERWGRHWLDAARYADSSGYSIDGPRKIWRYRDYVIDAFNADMPFDQFTVEQLAGDLLPGATEKQRIATGFHRNTMINEEGGVDPEEFRIEAMINRVNTTGTVYLGLTVGCAQCHTHKYDPITQREYYQFFAFFNNDDETVLSTPTPDELAKQSVYLAKVREKSAEIKKYVAANINAWEANVDRETISEQLQEALAIPVAKRSLKQKRFAEETLGEDDETYKSLASELEKLNDDPPDSTSTLILTAKKEQRETHVHLAGNFTRKGEAVEPGTPAALHPLRESFVQYTREDLAKWLVDRRNPLTARVTVNRLWQALFGKGIVETENDFGAQGTPPSHPELLDWLAVEFVEAKWRMKHMIRLMVTSATYRQSSNARLELDTIDPTNRLLARQNRLRLDAEIIRDNGLAVSGLLNPEIGGPSVHPPQPDGVMNLGQQDRAWNADTGRDRYRRGMYTFFWRATPYPALTVFDAPDALEACTRRNRSNTPLQALTLLNDEAFYEFAAALGKRVVNEAPEGTDRIGHMVLLALGRAATDEERDILEKLLEATNGNWTAAARAVLNTDELITRE